LSVSEEGKLDLLCLPEEQLLAWKSKSTLQDIP
jgi:hypothetical protein